MACNFAIVEFFIASSVHVLTGKTVIDKKKSALTKMDEEEEGGGASFFSAQLFSIFLEQCKNSFLFSG